MIIHEVLVCDCPPEVPPSWILSAYTSCYDALISFQGYFDFKRAFKARESINDTQEAETRFMTLTPDVVLVNQSQADTQIVSSVTSSVSSGYGSSLAVSRRDSIMSYNSDLSRVTTDSTDSYKDDDPSLALYMTEAPLVDNRIHYRTVGNQALADVMAQGYHLADLTLTGQPTNQWYNQGWRYLQTQRGVHILRRDTNKQQVYGIAGVGLIKKSPEYVYETIRDPYYRFQYDKLLKKLDIVENVDQHTKVVYAQLEAKQCLMKQSRDMVLVAADRQHNENYVTAVTSTEHPSCPPHKSVPRTEMTVSGFIISPYYQDDKLYTRLVYILQLDMKGLPSFVVDYVMKHQPLCISYIRDKIMAKRDPPVVYMKSQDSLRKNSAR